ncbi:MBL fold metallo-hydrolase [Amycolatopsis jejuensis]|uniref:MBL fold metallo-hydrolase n=1 Tax=Amycolatopsis jejuensis TaxID=330084 RepID=UPI0005240F7E|nr:MBL fold metallo-hydrolase [Amycolatopsis jejuensis]
MTWTEIADRVYVRRYDELDLTTGLVLGATSCLVIDTRGDVDQGAELAGAVRELTDLPWAVVYTHAHFDHAFGTTPFLPCDVWAHSACRTELVQHGETARQKWIAYYRGEEGKPAIADALGRTGIMLPDRLVDDRAELDLGGRTVALVHPGPAHTGHDLLVHVPDAGVVFAGDVVEHGPHGFTAFSFNPDSDLARWPAAMDVLLALEPRVVVPGHGEPVDAAFVRKHRDGLRTLLELRDTNDVAASPYPEDVTRAAFGARVS